MRSWLLSLRLDQAVRRIVVALLFVAAFSSILVLWRLPAAGFVVLRRLLDPSRANSTFLQLFEESVLHEISWEFNQASKSRKRASFGVLPSVVNTTGIDLVEGKNVKRKNSHFAAFFKIYKIFTILRRSNLKILQNFVKIFGILKKTLQNFAKFQKIQKISKFLKKNLKILDNFLQNLSSERCKSVKILQILKNAEK